MENSLKKIINFESSSKLNKKIRKEVEGQLLEQSTFFHLVFEVVTCLVRFFLNDHH